jgi:hypothetical protein
LSGRLAWRFALRQQVRASYVFGTLLRT